MSIEAQSTERERQLRIEREISIVRTDLGGAQRDHAEIAFKLVEKPGDTLIQAQLEELEREIAEHTRKIERLEAARAQAKLLDTDAAKKAALARLDELYAGIATRTERQKVLAAQIVAIAESFAPLLAEYDVLAADNQSASWVLLKSACGGDAKVADRHFGGLVKAVRGAAAVPGVVSALWASGLGRTGLDLRPWADISACGVIRPMDEDMNIAADRALSKLRDLIEQRKAQVNGVKVKPAPTQADRFIPGGKQLEEAKQESFKS